MLKADTIVMVNSSANIAYGEAFAYQALYDSTEEAYKFFMIENNIRRKPFIEDGLLQFHFLFHFANAEAWDLIARGDSGLQYFFDLVYDDGSGEEKSESFVFYDHLIKQYGEIQQTNPAMKYVIRAKFSSYNGLKGATVWSMPRLEQQNDVAYVNSGAEASEKLKFVVPIG